jgi:hypothetical protein
VKESVFILFLIKRSNYGFHKFFLFASKKDLRNENLKKEENKLKTSSNEINAYRTVVLYSFFLKALIESSSQL